MEALDKQNTSGQLRGGSDQCEDEGGEEDGTEPIAVKQQIPGAAYVGLRKVAGEKDVSEWLEDRAEKLINESLSEAESGIRERSESDVDILRVESSSILVTLEGVPEKDVESMELADRLLDITVGATPDELQSSVTIQLGLYDEAAEAIRTLTVESEKHDSVVEYIGDTVIAEVAGDI